ncbi:hypothetical protein Psuf_063530 [Phytohabitans suffuscus]|uniref:Uncharacterized protein n=1 Tax=Phytohabitans suffuscus TaxID=624315 RepID=A0A6F8YSA7_9ACTN|nr:hypothetical protein [Phytohabitans suffuscus]BCB89040.1 hypothetical protein Psuf_063530 [Phytohabitans suffuscus]
MVKRWGRGKGEEPVDEPVSGEETGWLDDLRTAKEEGAAIGPGAAGASAYAKLPTGDEDEDDADGWSPAPPRRAEEPAGPSVPLPSAQRGQPAPFGPDGPAPVVPAPGVPPRVADRPTMRRPAGPGGREALPPAGPPLVPGHPLAAGPGAEPPHPMAPPGYGEPPPPGYGEPPPPARRGDGVRGRFDDPSGGAYTGAPPRRGESGGFEQVMPLAGPDGGRFDGAPPRPGDATDVSRPGGPGDIAAGRRAAGRHGDTGDVMDSGRHGGTGDVMGGARHGGTGDIMGSGRHGGTGDAIGGARHGGTGDVMDSGRHGGTGDVMGGARHGGTADVMGSERRGGPARHGDTGDIAASGRHGDTGDLSRRDDTGDVGRRGDRGDVGRRGDAGDVGRRGGRHGDTGDVTGGGRHGGTGDVMAGGTGDVTGGPRHGGVPAPGRLGDTGGFPAVPPAARHGEPEPRRPDGGPRGRFDAVQPGQAFPLRHGDGADAAPPRHGDAPPYGDPAPPRRGEPRHGGAAPGRFEDPQPGRFADGPRHGEPVQARPGPGRPEPNSGSFQAMGAAAPARPAAFDQGRPAPAVVPQSGNAPDLPSPTPDLPRGGAQGRHDRLDAAADGDASQVPLTASRASRHADPTSAAPAGAAPDAQAEPLAPPRSRSRTGGQRTVARGSGPVAGHARAG